MPPKGYAFTPKYAFGPSRNYRRKTYTRYGGKAVSKRKTYGGYRKRLSFPMGRLRSKSAYSRRTYRRKGRVAPARNIGLPTQIYRFTAIVNVTSLDGRQIPSVDGALTNLDVTDCSGILTAAGYFRTTQSSEQYVTVYERRNVFHITNVWNSVADFDFYTLVSRRDHAAGYGPVSTWVSGMKRQDNASPNDYSILTSMKPFDSKQFCSAWKVMRVKHFKLKPGGTLRLTRTSKKHKRFNYNRSNDEFTNPASFAYFLNLSVVWMIVLKGSNSVVSGGNLIGAAQGRLVVTHDAIYKYYAGVPAENIVSWDGVANTDNQSTAAKDIIVENNPQYQNLGTTVTVERSV